MSHPRFFPRRNRYVKRCGMQKNGHVAGRLSLNASSLRGRAARSVTSLINDDHSPVGHGLVLFDNDRQTDRQTDRFWCHYQMARLASCHELLYCKMQKALPWSYCTWIRQWGSPKNKHNMKAESTNRAYCLANSGIVHTVQLPIAVLSFGYLRGKQTMLSTMNDGSYENNVSIWICMEERCSH